MILLKVWTCLKCLSLNIHTFLESHVGIMSFLFGFCALVGFLFELLYHQRWRISGELNYEHCYFKLSFNKFLQWGPFRHLAFLTEVFFRDSSSKTKSYLSTATFLRRVWGFKLAFKKMTWLYLNFEFFNYVNVFHQKLSSWSKMSSIWSLIRRFKQFWFFRERKIFCLIAMLL